ncbi:hypothetical protein [Actinocorallia sp. A-T 12471]|uniref:hypothetical protein n=1 Tax=Actinocorallia sp. A-T 12471 TaxID=3089813 RepID=UPI0029CEA351|nr:hypothetical protein [Actinocorallia sp. A-T 12471]MDX6743833.1 hypothetical protein [Actinocorallia sp. A-T 12471]
MPNLLIVRAADHLLLGVDWSGFTVTGTGPDGLPRLTAGENARIVLIFPPQHLAEEASKPNSPAPETRPAPPGGSVPVWRAALSGPSRLVFAAARDTVFTPTAEGVLAALADARPVADTAVELPWRMIFAPETRDAGDELRAVHPEAPVRVGDVAGLWRTRLVAVPPGEPPGSDANLALRAVDAAAAATPDPVFDPPSEKIPPLGRAERMRLAAEAAVRPATASRLELSSLGGTLSARGTWENFRWEHDAVLGRDMRVRTLTSGVLYPLGHRAVYLEFSERTFDPAAGGAAVLRVRFALTVTEPVRRPPQDGPAARAFPFDDVEITTLAYPDLDGAQWQDQDVPGMGRVPTHFWPKAGNAEVAFPLRCGTPEGDVRFELPLLFVADLMPGFPSLTDPTMAAKFAAAYGTRSAALPGVPLDLVRASREADSETGHRDGDVHEVHRLVVAGARDAAGFLPRLDALAVKLPALRTLLGEDTLRQVRFAEDYLRDGPVRDVLLELEEPIDVSFVGRTDRSGGLVAPHLVTDAISRTVGPVDLAALPDPGTGLIDPRSLFPADATLMGFGLKDLVTDLKEAPKITSVLRPGRPPATRMEWTGVKLKEAGPFKPVGASTLDLTVTVSEDGVDTLCTARNFALELPLPAHPLLRVQFAALSFTQTSGRPPVLDVTGVDVKFLGELQLLEQLGDVVDLGDLGPLLDVTPAGLVAGYSLPLPSVAAGAFIMRDMSLNAGIAVPFDGRPVSMSFGFGTRENPFTLAVLMFGGGGYVELEVDRTGLRRLEAALEFGAMIAVDFVVAHGEVHAFGGIRFVLTGDGEVSLTGYLRIGGCLEVLGVITVSVELLIELAYQSSTKALVGRAILVIEVDLTLWSDSVELDSGTWVLAGGGAGDRERVLAGGGATPEGLARWRAYQAAFAPL